MSQTSHARTQTYTGRRVQWVGPLFDGCYVVPSYWQELADTGVERLPREDEKRRLRTDELGTVGELLRTDQLGHWYVIEFDGGYPLETVLPSTLVAFVDQRASDQDSPERLAAAEAAPRRYAEHRVRSGWWRGLFASRRSR